MPISYRDESKDPVVPVEFVYDPEDTEALEKFVTDMSEYKLFELKNMLEFFRVQILAAERIKLNKAIRQEAYKKGIRSKEE
jgi:hypothetical protein